MAKRLDTTKGRDADPKGGPLVPMKTYKWPPGDGGLSLRQSSSGSVVPGT